MNNGKRILTTVCALCIASACSTQKHLNDVRNFNSFSKISLSAAPKTGSASISSGQESIVQHSIKKKNKTVRDEQGREMIIMNAGRDDETGEMVATEELDGVVVTATFRNVAERGGKVRLNFDITVPSSLKDSRWQLRFYPQMVNNLQDTLSLDPLYITGIEYRKTQLKGYQQYEKFLSKIVSDTTIFINSELLEIFLKRNIPQIYAYKSDSTEVSETEFYSSFGVSDTEALEHYTNKFRRDRNNRLKSNKGRMFNRYVKAPIQKDGIRLDTVMNSESGDYIYHYQQVLESRPGVKKVEIWLSGDIYEQDKQLFRIPKDGPVTFYISSLATFADMSDHYITKVIERAVLSSASFNLHFNVGSSELAPQLDSNSNELGRIEQYIRHNLESEEFELDSIVIRSSASPDGPLSLNNQLSRKRGIALTQYLGGSYPMRYQVQGENWNKLAALVDNDSTLTTAQKQTYQRIVRNQKDLDKREQQLSRQDFGPYLKSALYPALRCVDLDLHMHRRGMLKDTIHTSIIDTTYMNGVTLLRDMKYEEALHILGPYKDYNTAVTLLCLFENKAAYRLLQALPQSAENEYLMAVCCSRENKDALAAQHFIKACELNSFYHHRGNLDPEISRLIDKLGLQ